MRIAGGLKFGNKGWTVGGVTQAIFAVGVPFIVLPVALVSVPVALASAGALVLLTMAAVVGVVRTGTVLLIAAFATVAWTKVHPVPLLGFLELSDALFAAGFLVLIPRFVTTPLRLPAIFIIGAVGFVTVGTLSALASDQARANFGMLLDVVGGIVLFPILLTWWRAGSRSIVACAVAYIAGNAVSVAATLFQEPMSEDRYAGLTTHPNVLGMCQVLSLALVPFVVEAVPRQHRWIILTMCLIPAYGIWVSGSRAAVLTAVFLLAVYPLFKRSIPAALILVGGSLPAIHLINHFAERVTPTSLLGRLFGRASVEGSNTSRIEGARAGLDQFLSHPFLGDGWTTVWGAHNSYLQVAAAVGVIGLLCYLLILTQAIAPIVTAPAPYRWLAGPGLATAIITVVDPSVGSGHIWSLLALAFSARRLAGLEEDDSRVTEAPGRPVSTMPAPPARVATSKRMGAPQ